MKSTTTISIDKGLLARARSHAREQKRSLSAQIEQWLEERFTATTAAAATSAPALRQADAALAGAAELALPAQEVRP